MERILLALRLRQSDGVRRGLGAQGFQQAQGVHNCLLRQGLRMMQGCRLCRQPLPQTGVRGRDREVFQSVLQRAGFREQAYGHRPEPSVLHAREVQGL